MGATAGLVVAVALCCAAPPAVAAEVVRVGLYDNSPKVGVGPDGTPEGIFVDLIEAIAAREGWTLQFVRGTWGEGLERLEAGAIDLMPDVARTAERERIFAFHGEPVLSSWNQIYAPHGSAIRALPDLAGRRVAVLDGSVQERELESLAESFDVPLTVSAYPDYADAFAAVAAGEADAVVTNRFFGIRHATAAGLSDTAIIFAPSRLYFAAPRGGPRLEAIDRHLRAFKRDADSVFYRSLRRWTSDDVGPSVPAWVVPAVLGGIALLLAALAWVITLRRLAVRLRESERQQHALARELGRVFEYSLDAICVFDSELRFTRVSASCETLWGYRPDELVGRRYLELVAADDPWRAIAEGRVDGHHEPTHRFLSRAPCKDGATIPTMWSVVWSEADRRWYCTARDDSERQRLLDDAQRRAEALKQSSARLAVAKDAAETADRLKSVFLATMSHELRTPLNSIIGFTGIILQELPGPLNAEQKKQLDMVQQSARHLLALINDVLDISKIEAGELTMRAAPFDLSASITKVAGIVLPLAARKGLTFTVSGVSAVEAAEGPMVGDARRVEQILLNLLGNAVKFTERGSVGLDVAVVDHAPHERGASELAVRMTVTDTGIGIKPEDMSLLFEPFRQLDTALSRKHEGTGLGLAICARLAALMGGRVVAESRLGEGSTFTLTLPLSGAAEEPAPRDPASRPDLTPRGAPEAR